MASLSLSLLDEGAFGREVVFGFEKPGGKQTQSEATSSWLAART